MLSMTTAPDYLQKVVSTLPAPCRRPAFVSQLQLKTFWQAGTFQKAVLGPSPPPMVKHMKSLQLSSTSVTKVSCLSVNQPLFSFLSRPPVLFHCPRFGLLSLFFFFLPSLSLFLPYITEHQSDGYLRFTRLHRLRRQFFYIFRNMKADDRTVSD